MAKVCEICGRGPMFGNNISHAHNVTKRRWNINLAKGARRGKRHQERRSGFALPASVNGKVQKAI